MKNNVAVLVILIALFFAGWILYSSNTFPFVSSAPIEEDRGNEGTAPLPVEDGEPQAKCYVGGCSSQICSDQEDVITTCEFREEYACYRSARCERQSNGQCGWTPSPELSMCLSQAE